MPGTWKRNKPALLARAQAPREVRKTPNETGTYMLHQPRDGRLFLTSNVDAGRLARRHRIRAWLHLVVMAGAVAGAAFITK